MAPLEDRGRGGMSKYISLFISVLIVSGCAGDSPTGEARAPGPGFDPADLGTDTRPQDDFFEYVNGPWIERTEIPPEYARYGAMYIVHERTEQQIHALLDEITSRPDRPPGSEPQKIADLYLAFMDEERVEDLALEPLADELERIDALETHGDVTAWFGRALAIGITVPINFYVDADAANPDRNLAYLWQDGLGLPDRDYWLSDASELAAVREAYLGHIRRMYELAQWPDGEQAAENIADLERLIAESHWTKVQNRDRQKIYTNKFTLEQAIELSAGFDWRAFLAAARFGAPETFVIAQTDYFAVLGDIVTETPVSTWRDYARFRTLKAFAPYLSRGLVFEDFEFERRTLRGQQEIRPRWKRGVRLVNRALGEPVGKAYVDRHFPPEAKQRVEEMIENLREAFGRSIDGLDWMSDETKAAARLKLAAFNAKIAYPDVWRDYSALRIAAGDLVGNVRRANEFEHDWHVGKLGRPIDRTEWGMPPQTVNAYYRFTWNEIVFPAAILQAPFFDFDFDDALNYGAIGSIIGHEFSHGFDDQGRKFDGDGRLSDWWTAADADQYEARSVGLVRQFDAYEPLPGQAINGQLTLGENIADLAGVIMAYRAWELSLDGASAPVIDGFTGPERFFIGYASSWRAKMRDEYLLNMLISDPHSPPQYRVIGALKNVPEFYETYEVSEGDGMFLPESERVHIW
jgi:predicted metalloendopeptidase